MFKLQISPRTLILVVNIKFPWATYHMIVPTTEKLHYLTRACFRDFLQDGDMEMSHTREDLSQEQSNSVFDLVSIWTQGLVSQNWDPQVKLWNPVQGTCSFNSNWFKLRRQVAETKLVQIIDKKGIILVHTMGFLAMMCPLSNTTFCGTV